MKFSGLFLHAETFPLQNWISSNTTLRQGLTPLWVGPCFKPWSGVNWNLPRFSLLLHLRNKLAFYSALDASHSYRGDINWFFVLFSSYFVGLIPIKIRTRLCLADSGFVTSAVWGVDFFQGYFHCLLHRHWSNTGGIVISPPQFSFLGALFFRLQLVSFPIFSSS